MLYKFKIQIRGIKKPPVWRRILVPGQFTFNDFHRVIQAAFSWNGEHLYKFGHTPYDRELNISVPLEYRDGWHRPTYDSTILTLEKFFSLYSVSEKLCYVYDLGQYWIHDITLETTTEEERACATCIEGKSNWSEDGTIACADEDADLWGECPRPAPEGFNLERVNSRVMAVRPLEIAKKETKAAKRPVAKHKVYPSVWMDRQPYSKQTNIDQYYIEITNRVLEVLDDMEDSFSFWGIDRVHRECMALALGQWFQDVVSEGGIWTAFTSECKRRYGSYLPFYPIDEEEYYCDEVNLVDVQFLTWHYIQYMHDRDSVVNPENYAVNEIAGKLFEIFDSEFENAPINDDWHDALHPKTFGEPLLYSFRDYLCDLLSCDYLCLNIFDSEAIYTDEVYANKSKQANADDFVNDHIVSSLFLGDENLIGMSMAEWGREILREENESIARRLDTITTLPSRLYLVKDEDEKYFHLVDYVDMKAGDAAITYKVLKDSFGHCPANAYEKGQTLVLCRLTSIEGEWNLNGVSFAMPVADYAKKSLGFPAEYITPHSVAKALYDKFMEATGGKPFVFPKNKKEAFAFFGKLTGIDAAKEWSGSASDIVVFASPVSGVGLSTGTSRWLKSDDNPRYDKEAAKENAFSIICKENIPYEVASKMYDMGMLEDAALKSAKGYDHGRRFLHDNAQFLMDYFRHGKRN